MDRLSSTMFKAPRQVTVALVSVFIVSCASSNSVRSVAGAGGVQIVYEVTGRGDTALVFVHGWSCDRTYWREQVPFFSDTYKVVTVDLGGHGESATTRGDWSIESFGKDVAAVADAAGSENVVLIGHSMGGPVVVDAATRIGDRVVGVVGVDTFRDLAVRPMTPDQAAIAFSDSAEEFPSNTEALVRNRFFTESSPTYLVDSIATDMAAANHVVATAARRSLNTYDSVESIRSIDDIPLVLINSDYRPTNEAALRGAHPAGSVVTISKSGHFVMLERPEQFNSELSTILRDLQPNRRDHEN